MRKLVAGVSTSMDRIDAYFELWSNHYLNTDHLRDLRQVLSQPYWGPGRTVARGRR